MSDLNMAVALSYVAVWNSSEFDALDHIIHPDYRARRGDRLMASGVAALKAWYSGLHEMFPRTPRAARHAELHAEGLVTPSRT